MGFFNSVKNLVTNNNPPKGPNNSQGDNFQVGVNNPSDQNFSNPNLAPNSQPPASTFDNSQNNPQFIQPNVAYKQNQLNNTNMLYNSNQMIKPGRINPSGQYNYYLDINNEEAVISAQENFVGPQHEPGPAGYVEPYYNHEVAHQYQPVAPQQILPRRMMNQNGNQNYGPNNFNGPQPQMPSQQQYYNKLPNEGYFNEEHMYVNQYRRPYQRRIINPHNQMNMNEFYDQQQFNDYGPNNYGTPNYSSPVNPTPGFHGPGQFNGPGYQNPNYLQPIEYNPSVPAGNVGAEVSRYAYQPQLTSKQHSNKLSKEHINKLMPFEIAREIRSEKISSLVMTVIGIFGTICTSLFIALYFVTHNNGMESIIGIKAIYIPHPFLTITLLIISLGVLFSGIFDLSRVRREANTYVINLNRGNHTIPHFLINNYKKMTVRGIVLNWVAFPTYVFGAIILGILYGFQQHKGEQFMFGFWSWGIVDDLTAAITINIIILIAMLGIHITNIILTKKRKANIIGYYGYEIVKPEELAALRKKTNRICLVIFIIFLIILTLLISIPWLIARRKKAGKGVPIIGRWFNKG
ncbi:MSC_0882 family membrane protein [Spiroplasma chrysopicola]|uniref:Transmembrane protein n=1 Tax=Spiroplasma chrysopicola DF-1 TaxID=1276227 RepID=R4U328_9MOLU|nr:hypothetical protein [Spiroplasma chrysopicola]AGM24893.1 hypothetical protein SCHRY_v1c03080 [Spiroplasma chrysopicola DF-1]